MTLSIFVVVSAGFPEELEEPILQYDSASKCVRKNQWYFRFSCLFVGVFFSITGRSNMSKLASEKKDFLFALFRNSLTW